MTRAFGSFTRLAASAVALLAAGAAHADIVMGASAMPLAVAMAPAVAEARTPHFVCSPAVTPAGGGARMFRPPQGNAVMALKAGQPGTPEFHAALKAATESMGRTVVAHGVLNYTKSNHWGFTTETGLVVKVVNGDWKVEP